MKNTEVAALFKTIADSFQALSDIYSSTEDAPQPKATAKKEKDFARADAIRDELLAKGVAIKDTREGVKWELV